MLFVRGENPRGGPGTHLAASKHLVDSFRFLRTEFKAEQITLFGKSLF